MKLPVIDNSLIKSRSIHNTSCNWTGTTEFGRLIPFHVEELDPSVTIKTCRPKIEMQMLNFASPTFGKIDLYVHYFFVPLRLIWDAADNFFERQGPLKGSIPPYTNYRQLAHIYATAPSGVKRAYFKHWTSLGLPPFFTLYDSYFSTDVPANVNSHLTLLKFRAYQQIWWDFYRDPELLRDEAVNNYLTKSSGSFDSSNMDLATERQFMPRVRNITDNWLANLFTESGLSPSALPLDMIVDDVEGLTQVTTGNNADLGHLNRTSVQLRKMEALTRLAERLSLGGKRAIDAMYAAYGVKPNFLKMQMAQYLGGAKSEVRIADLTSSADTLGAADADNNRLGLPLGAKAAVGYCALSDLNINFTAQEHGYLIGIVSVMPKVHFVQGIDKSWFRNSLEDWFTKSLERTGQVAVSRKEVAMLSHNSPAYSRGMDDFTFGFTQPYYELKRGQDILAGDFAYYHNANEVDHDGNLIQQLQYMQSMEMYVDYPNGRAYDSESMKIEPSKFNKIFYYIGGSLWDDVDDHFHLCIDKEVVKDTPYDGYAVPTLETTKDPHESSGPVGNDTVL